MLVTLAGLPLFVGGGTWELDEVWTGAAVGSGGTQLAFFSASCSILAMRLSLRPAPVRVRHLIRLLVASS